MIAESYERIHRSNLVGMGILPLQFLDGRERRVARPDRRRGRTTSSACRRAARLRARQDGARCAATKADGTVTEFDATVRIDTPQEIAVLPARRHPAVRAAPTAEQAGRD